jgi:WD40 repeat protein/tetratricopeptide (TPR) repeat protein/tRNA A-37 threonylcarbamoyl transferase component Bud32
MSDERAEEKTTPVGRIEREEVESTLAGGLTEGLATVGSAPRIEPTLAYKPVPTQGLTLASGSLEPMDRPTPSVAGYEILGELGRGAVGVVYHARQVRLNRPCALKMILAGEHTGPEAALRFLAEAEAVARLQHPNVVQIHNLGESGGLPFVELEYAPGGSLDKQLDGVPWSPRAAAKTIEALAQGVAEAHRLGIVHRDLKPANILLGSDGTPKVADFGLAKSVGLDSGLTRTDSVLGTPSYMAPEQADGRTREVGPPADVYALGAILYELVTGRPPLRGTTVLETLALVKETEPVPPSRLAPGLPRDLETIALKCLEKEPARRYESSADLAADLGRWLNDEPIAARPSTFWERTWKSARRRPWQAAMIALAASFLAAMLGVWVWSYVRIGEALEIARLDRIKADAAKNQSDRWVVEATRLTQEANRLAMSEASARADSTRRSAALALDKGVLLAESGRVGRGLLWMDRAFESAAGLDEPLRRASRAGLADWSLRATRPRAVLDLARSTYNLDFRGDLGVLAIGCNSRPAVLDPSTLQELPWFLGDDKNMGWKVAVIVSGDGRRLAASDGIRLIAWDIASGSRIGEFPKQANEFRPTYLATDHDGRRFATVDFVDGKIWVWDLTGHGPEARSVLPSGNYREVVFSHDGRLIASVREDRILRVWDARTLALVREFPASLEPSRADFLPGGSSLVLWSTDLNATVAVWDIDAPRPRFERSMGSGVTGLTTRRDGRAVLIGCRDGSIRLLEASSGEPLGPVIHADTPVLTSTVRRLQEGMQLRSAVALSPDGQTILSTHADATARLWDLATGRPVGSVMEHGVGLVGAGFGPGGRTALTVTAAGQVVLWDIAEGPTGRILSHAGGLGTEQGEVSPDGRLVVATGGNRRHAMLVDVASGLPRSGPLLHNREIVRVARFSPDGSLLATGGDDRFVRLWDLAGRPIGQPLLASHWATNVGFSPDGKTLIAFSAGRTIQAWDVASGKLLGAATTPSTDNYESFFLFSPDGRILLTRTTKGDVMRWEVPTLHPIGEPLRATSSSEQAVPIVRVEVSGTRPFGFSPDGSTLWLAEAGPEPGSSVVGRRDPKTWERIGKPIGRDVDQAVLEANGRRLLARSATTVRLYDAATGAQIGMALEHPAPVLTMAFSPDGSRIATGAEDGGLRFWDAESGRPIGPSRAHPGPVAALKFFNDGRRVATFVDVPRVWDSPRSLADDPARIAAGVRAASRMELDQGGDGTHQLPLDTWRRLRESRDGSGDFTTLPEADWHERLATRFALQGPPEAALWHLDRLLTLRPDDVPALLRRSGVRARSGDAVGAAEDASKAAALDPSQVQAWRDWRVFDAELEGRTAEALAELDSLITASPKDLRYRAARYRLRLRVGRRAEAASDLLEVIRSRTQPTGEFYQFALLALEMGDSAAYHESCARFLSLVGSRTSPSLANSAAWQLVLAEGAPGAERAVALAEAAVDGFPAAQKVLAVNTLGVALYRAGQYSEAVEKLEESVRLGNRGGFPQDWAFLALAYHRLGDESSAARWLERLQAWRPEGTPQSFWNDIEIELSRREALAVIRFDPAFPADPFARD